MTIDSVRKRDFHEQDFTDSEVAAMTKDGDTSKVMNDVRRQAGLTTAGVTIRGDDKDFGELRSEWEQEDMRAAGMGLGEHMVVEAFGEGAGALLAIPFFAEHGIEAVINANERAAALKDAGEKGAMHLAMISALHVPDSYKATEVERWKEAGCGGGGGAQKMGDRLEIVDHEKAAVLQLHADRGMNAAADLIARGVVTRNGGDDEVKKALDSDPSLKAKYESDPAFRAGFDGLVWSKRHDSQQTFDKQLTELGDRDLRYAKHHIPCRG